MNEKKYKIIFVGSFPKKGKIIYGGQYTACKALLNSEFGEKYNLYTIDSTSISNPPPNFLIRILLAIKRLIEFSYKVILFKPRVVIIFVADKFSAIEKGLMILISKLFNKNVLIFPRAGALINQCRNIFFKKYINFTFNKADLFLCQGKTFQEFAIKKLNFSKCKAPIIPNWTANSKLLEIGRDRNFNQDNKTAEILFIGWLEEFKGVKEILKAAYILKNKKYNFHIYLAGDGNMMTYAKSFIKKFNLEKNISLTGWIDNSYKKKLLSKSTIFLLPSWNEGLPNAMIEAMSAGLACIISKVGMVPDYAIDGFNSLLVEPKNVQNIVRSLEKVLQNPLLRQKLSKNAYQTAKSNFSLDNGLKLLTKEIENLIEV